MNKIQNYLTRIGLPQDMEISQTYEFLSKLQYAHVTTVPYENLDILDGVPLSLDEDALYDKIVTRGRGGYCFELNGALSHLLRNMGFEVKDHFARYLRGESDIPARRHRVLSVKCGNEIYMCDTGIGEKAPRLPLLLKEGVIQEQYGEAYRFEKDLFLGWVLCDLHKGMWRRFFSFTDEEQLDIDFSHSSFYCEKHPESPFNKDIMVALKTSDGRLTLDGNIFKVWRGDELISVETAESDARVEEILRDVFGLKK